MNATNRHSPLAALDLKIDDEALATDIVRLAKEHDVLDHVVCIGLAISDPAVRKRLRAATGKLPVAVLANALNELDAAIADSDSDWVYVRFMPSSEQVGRIHSAGKRIFLSGPLVAGEAPEHWRQAVDCGVDALLTDYPLECQQFWRAARR